MHKWQQLSLACEEAPIISAAVARAFLCLQESMRPQATREVCKGFGTNNY